MVFLADLLVISYLFHINHPVTAALGHAEAVFASSRLKQDELETESSGSRDAINC
jgi:hypothetical protein